jgi:uncharacterized protein YecE (DUF72 family)
MAKLRIGISGWRYPPWRGRFYPKDLPQRLELNYASRQLDTIEINGSFYSLQRPESWRNWYRDTPRGFVFSVKAPRFITHMRRLRDIEKPLANFFASGVLELREKLGPLLWQFPPRLKYDHGLFDAFFSLLPRDSKSAQSLARHHDNHIKHVGDLSLHGNRRLRHAIEIRHESFEDRSFPMRHRSGRSCRTSPRDSSTCVCMATRSFTRAATPTPRWTIGRDGYAPGRRARNRAGLIDVSVPRLHRRVNRAISTAISITTAR